MKRKALNLGDLELAVLEHLWSVGEGDAKAVHKQIGRARDITLNTVQSTLDRLFKKQLLARDKVSHAFVYRPKVSKADLSSMLIDAVIFDKQSMLAAFVNLADQADALADLAKLVAAKRRAAGDA